MSEMTTDAESFPGPPAPRLTLRAVQARLREVGMVCCPTGWGDYEVRTSGITGGGYFASDLDDALATGLEIAPTRRRAVKGGR